MNNKPILVLERISKSFKQGKKKVRVIEDISLNLFGGDVVALVGPSGSGKTTLLQIAGLLDKPDLGKIFINGKRVDNATDSMRTKLRRKDVGFVYQFHHLLPDLTAVENIILPQRINGIDKETASKRALEMLEFMGLKNRATHKPFELSGGEQQRIAIARALINKPSVILADEPTGNLDSYNSEEIFKLFVKIAKSTNMVIFMVTHNMDLAKKADRIIRIQDGKIN